MRTRTLGLFLLIVASCAASLMLASRAEAQTCTATSTTACFDASVKSGPAPLATTLVWSAPGASSCTASGAGTVSGWSGLVATSGTRNLTGIGVDINPKLTCPIPGQATLNWSAPTTNSDGSTITDLAGFIVLYGVSPTALVSTVAINNASTTTLVVKDLAAGPWSFAVRAKNAAGAESVNSAVVGKTIVGSSFTATVPIDVTPVPSPPTGLSVTETTAMEIRPSSTGALIASRIGYVPLGTRCYEEQRTAAGVTYNGVPFQLVDLINWPAQANLREAWAKCG